MCVALLTAILIMTGIYVQNKVLFVNGRLLSINRVLGEIASVDDMPKDNLQAEEAQQKSDSGDFVQESNSIVSGIISIQVEMKRDNSSFQAESELEFREDWTEKKRYCIGTLTAEMDERYFSETLAWYSFPKGTDGREICFGMGDSWSEYPLKEASHEMLRNTLTEILWEHRKSFHKIKSMKSDRNDIWITGTCDMEDLYRILHVIDEPEIGWTALFDSEEDWIVEAEIDPVTQRLCEVKIREPVENEKIIRKRVLTICFDKTEPSEKWKLPALINEQMGEE